MLYTLKNRELRHKLEWLAGIILLTRIISMIPVPGVDATVFKQWITQNSNDALNLFSSFTGGAFESFSIFALGITPLITAQIIVQLMTGIVPSLAKLQKKGEHGQKGLKWITNIGAIIMAAVQSCCMAIGFSNSGLISGNGIIGIVLVTISMTLGTGIMIGLSELLKKHSVGDGVSILLMVNIVAKLPREFSELFTELTEGKTKLVASASCIAAILILTAMVVVIIYMTEGYHPLPVQYSQKISQSGEAADMGEIPVKVSILGVMPVVFAASLMAIPQLVATIAGKGYGSGFSKILLNMMSQDNWFNGENQIYSFGLLIYLFLIIFFSFFYLPITFNGAEVSDSIRKCGGFIPGIRAGAATEVYITNIARYLTSIGTVMLILVTVIPTAISCALGLDVQISGTSLIIVIGVVTDTIQKIRLEMAGHDYSGLLSL